MKKSKDEMLLQLFIAAQGCLGPIRCHDRPGLPAPALLPLYLPGALSGEKMCTCIHCAPLFKLQAAVDAVKKGFDE